MSKQEDVDRMIAAAILGGLLEPAQRAWAQRMCVVFSQFDENGVEAFHAWLMTQTQVKTEKMIRRLCDRGQPGR